MQKGLVIGFFLMALTFAVCGSVFAGGEGLEGNSSRKAEEGEGSRSNSFKANERQDLIQKLIDDKRFLEIFRQARQLGQKKGGGSFEVTDAVSSYINKYYNSKKEVFAFLEGEGFKLYPQTSGKEGVDDGEVIATRQEKAYFLVAQVEHRIILRVKEDSIQGISAYTFYHGL